MKIEYIGGSLYKVVGNRKYNKPTYDHKIDRIMELAKSYGVTRLIIFGDYIDNPDIARVIHLACEGVEDWRICELAAQLEDEVKMPVDLVKVPPASSLTESIYRHSLRLI